MWRESARRGGIDCFRSIAIPGFFRSSLIAKVRSERAVEALKTFRANCPRPK